MSLETARLRLERMRDITRLLNDLDFDDESDLERVDVLQREQEEIREKLTSLMPELMQITALKELVMDCIQMEQELQVKIIRYREQARENIHKFQLGSRSKRTYTNGFYQTEGYFVDRKK